MERNNKSGVVSPAFIRVIRLKLRSDSVETDAGSI